MSIYLDAFEGASTVGYTENGAVTFTSTLNRNLDYFAQASAKRERPGEAVSLFSEAYHENPALAMLNLFYLRDVRGGQGERNIFRMCLERIDVDFLKNEGFLSLIPEYGRWDDLINLLYKFSMNKDVVSAIIKVIKSQIDEDVESKHPSLLAKWIPLANSVSNPERKQIAHMITTLLGIQERDWRKIIVGLRKKINVVERLMSSRRWPEIRYEHVPSRASIVYKNAYMRHDGERYTQFLVDLKSGKVKINAACLYPYEVIYRLREKLNIDVGFYYMHSNGMHGLNSSDPEIVALEEMWKALPAFMTKGNVLTVVDVSGSMLTPVSGGKAMAIDVSTSLGLYCAQHNEGPFKNSYISFSDNPKLLKLNPERSLAENLAYVLSTDIGYSTDFEKVFRIILKGMVDNNLPKEECPSIVLAISDMEFNCAGAYTNFESIKEMYSRAGYDVPQLVFWNVASRGRNVPVRKDENGVVLVSGLSPSILKFISEGEINPEKFMMNVLLSERYRPIIEVIAKIA